MARETWPLFTSDALRHYAPVLLEVFGLWQRPTPTGMPGRPCHPTRIPHPLLGYAQVEKHRQGSRVVDVNRRVIFGAPDEVLARAQGLRRSNGRKGTINTAYVERHNLTLREENGRLSRKTLAFSKKRRELQHQLDFWRAYANFVRPHRLLRAPAPSGSGPRRWLPRTPAMAAGLATHVWTLDELLRYKHWIYQP
ncbi:MAG TPA: IS1 family transposase [Candidatus Methylomirabilis sp.]